VKKKDLKVYFAHSKKIYNTDLEKHLKAWLKKQYREVICPNKDMGELGSVEPYLEMIDTCDIIICREHMGYFGRGVYDEVKHALKRKKLVMVMRHDTNNKIYLERVFKVKIVDECDWEVRYGKIKDKGPEW
jgi:hypothetical protein